MQQITDAIRNERYSLAIELADRALHDYPKDAKLWTLKGIAYEESGDLTGSMKSFETAVQLSPNYVPALAGAAETNYKAGSDRASFFLERLLKLKPDDLTAHAMLAAIAYKRRDCKKAVAQFVFAQSAVSSSPEALSQYGACLLYLEEPDKATGVFLSALALRPDDARVRRGLATAQFRSNQPQEVLKTLEPLLNAANSDPDALSLASAAQEDVGNTPKAVELLRTAIVDTPRNPQNYVDFALLCFNHSSFQVGIDMIDEGLKLLPDSATLYLARGVLYVQAGKFPEAEADFERANRLDPSQGIASLAEGLSLVQQDNLDAALDAAQRELKKRPDDAFLHFLIAEILAQKGAAPGDTEFQQAIREGERAVKLRPDFVLAHDTLAGLYLKANQIQLSIHHAREALRLLPSDQVALYHLIQALRKSARQQELPQLVKHLSELRQETRDNEALQNRYKIFETQPGN